MHLTIPFLGSRLAALADGEQRSHMDKREFFSHLL